MKNKIRYIKFKHLFVFLVMVLMYAMCMEITGVDQPESASAGSTITVTVHVDMKPEQNNNNNLIFGVLAPKEWNIGAGGTASFDSPYDFGDGFPAKGPMRVAGNDFVAFPEDEAKGIDGNKNGETWAAEIEKQIGIGDNYGEVEWIVFVSENKVKVREDEDFSGTITVTLPVGSAHTATQLGYFVGNANHGVKTEDPPRDDGKGKQHYDTFFPNCIKITGASSDATDLCGPAPTNLVFMTPEEFLFNDIVTIQFDAKEGKEGSPTELLNAGTVYACATARFADGSSQSVCDNSPKTQMILTGNNIWELTIWPRGYFGIGAGQVMTELHLNFQNQDGSIIVRNPVNDKDVVVIPVCN